MPRAQTWGIRRPQAPTRIPPATSAHCSEMTSITPPARRVPLAPRRTPRPPVTKPDTSLRTQSAHPPRVAQAQLQARRATPPLTPCPVRVLRRLLTRRCRVRVLRQLLTKRCRVRLLRQPRTRPCRVREPRLAPTRVPPPPRPEGPQRVRPLHPPPARRLPAHTSRPLRHPAPGPTLIRTRQSRLSAQRRQRIAVTPACRRRRMGCPAGSPRAQPTRTSRRTM